MIVPERLTAVMNEVCRSRRIPGMVLGLLTPEGRSVAAYGVVSQETNYPVRRDTLFQIGSITKVFVATLLLFFVEEGKLQLDQPLIRVFPDLELADPETTEQLTLRHLLTHTSGLEGDHFEDYGPGDDALTRFVSALRRIPVLSPPGQLGSYCNSGFCLAGRILEVLTSQPFEQVMAERLLAPLGLERTFFFLADIIGYPFAVGHRTNQDGIVEVVRDCALPRSIHPAGGMWSTIDDLLTFAALHLRTLDLTKHPISTATIALLREPQIPGGNWANHYGLGWALWSCGGVRFVGHGGSTNGYQAHLVLLPEQRIAIAALTNHDQGSTAYLELETWLLQELLRLRPEPPPLVTLSPDQLACFNGHHRYPLADLTVQPVPGGLWLHLVQQRGLSRHPREQPLPPCSSDQSVQLPFS